MRKIVVSEGISLDGGMDLTKLKLLESKPSSLGIILLTYELTKRR